MRFAGRVTLCALGTAIAAAALVAGNETLAGSPSPAPAAPDQTSATSEQSVRTYHYLSYGRWHAVDAYRSTAWASPHPAVIFIHGGGWWRYSRLLFGTNIQLAPTAQQLVDQGFAVISPDFGLAPEHRFPEGLRDVQTAIAWVRRQSAALGIDPSRLAVWGNSSGANMAAWVGMAGTGAQTVGSRVRAVVSWSGEMDFPRLVRVGWSTALAENILRYLGCHPTSCPLRAAAASPIHWVDPSDPPVFIANSTDEVVPLDQAVRMADRLTAADVRRWLFTPTGSLHGSSLKPVAWANTLRFLHFHLD